MLDAGKVEEQPNRRPEAEKGKDKPEPLPFRGREYDAVTGEYGKGNPEKIDQDKDQGFHVSHPLFSGIVRSRIRLERPFLSPVFALYAIFKRRLYLRYCQARFCAERGNIAPLFQKEKQKAWVFGG